MEFLKQKKKVYLVKGLDIIFEFNKLYVSCEKNKMVNKTNKKRYMISNEFFLEDAIINPIEKLPKDIQMILMGQYGGKYLLNNVENKKFSGYFKILIQINPRASFNINKYFNIISDNENISKSKIREITHNKVIEKMNRECFLEYNEQAKTRKEEIYNLLINGKKNILYIGDDFTYMNLKNEFNVLNLSFSDIIIVKNLLEDHFLDFKIDMLFIESLWEGKDKTWKFFEKQTKYEAIKDIIDFAKIKRIKSILYNKEDPVHFNSFLPIAKMVDVVITTASDKVKDYESYGINAFHLPFFIDEEVFNSFEEHQLQEKIFFAGSYYTEKYSERAEFMNCNFPKFGKDFDLFIYDRNKNLKNMPNMYPNNLKQYIKSGGLPVEQIVKETKNYKYTINMNSVINSDTMIARRLFEQLALGKIVVSNYAKSIAKCGLEGVIYDEDNNYENIKQSMLNTKNDYEDRLNRSMKVLRIYSTFVFREKIYNILKIDQFDYLNYLYCKINTVNDYLKLLNSLGNQTFKNYILLLDIKDNNKDIKNFIEKGYSSYEIKYYDDSFKTDNYVINYDFSKIYEENFVLDMILAMNALNENSIKLTAQKTHKTVIYLNSSVFGRKIERIVKIEEVKKDIQNFSDFTIINNVYPSYENLYSHAFVHTRVKLYMEKDIYPYVIILKRQENLLQYYVFDDVLVIEMNEEGLELFKEMIPVKAHGIHFINPYIYDALEKNCQDDKKIVWFHGADCLKAEQKKHLYNLDNEYQKKDYERRMESMNKQYKMLGKLFENKKYSSVFVSEWLKNEVEKNIPKLQNFSIIPNPIDVDFFEYNDKKINSVVNVLTIRPFLLENDQYANELLIEFLKKVNDSKIANKINFTFYGRGNGLENFQKAVNDLKNLNINIFDRYLLKNEIKKAHEENHILLMPNNQDTHGVSYFEGVSSGLLGIASDNTAKSEYVKHMKTGILHETDNANDLFEKLLFAVENYNDLNKIRIQGSEDVKNKFNNKTIRDLELELLINK